MSKRIVAVGATLALAVAVLMGFAASPVEPAVDYAPVIGGQYVEPTQIGANIGPMFRGHEAIIQWERVASWDEAEWLEFTFVQGDFASIQILPPDATWAHVDGVAPGVGGYWSIVDSDGVAFNSGGFSVLALED